MADFVGLHWTMLYTVKKQGRYFNGAMRQRDNRAEITIEKPYQGIASLCLRSGDVRDIPFGTDAGTAKANVYNYPPVIGKCILKVIDPDGWIEMGRAYNVGAGAWEKLEVEFTAEKKVYVIRLTNATPASGDKRAWFDNILIQ